MMSTKNLLVTSAGVFAGFQIGHRFLPIDLAQYQMGPINGYDLAQAALVAAAVLAAHMIL